MSNRLMAIGGILALVVGLVLLVLPVQRIPLLDANRTVLAESEREGYCTGRTYAETRGRGDKNLAGECRAESSLPNVIDWNVVQGAFCRGLIASGFPITQPKCVEIMVAQRFWPTMDGSISASWNRKFPYPGDVIVSGTVDDSRTGDRDGIGREGLTRGP